MALDEIIEKKPHEEAHIEPSAPPEEVIHALDEGSTVPLYQSSSANITASSSKKPTRMEMLKKSMKKPGWWIVMLLQVRSQGRLQLIMADRRLHWPDLWLHLSDNITKSADVAVDIDWSASIWIFGDWTGCGWCHYHRYARHGELLTACE